MEGLTRPRSYALTKKDKALQSIITNRRQVFYSTFLLIKSSFFILEYQNNELLNHP